MNIRVKMSALFMISVTCFHVLRNQIPSLKSKFIEIWVSGHWSHKAGLKKTSYMFEEESAKIVKCN